MSLDTKIKVALDGQVYSRVIDFSLDERVGAHSVFSVSIRGRDLERSLGGASIMDSSRQYLGKSFSLQIEPSGKVDYETLYFKGIVTQVKGTKGKEKDGLGDVIHIIGKSASILLDDHPNTQSFLEESLSEIVSKSTRNYESYGLRTDISPENDQQILYSVQQQKNTFEFLQHLAARHGEYLLYSKDTLYFGKPNLGNEVELRYGYDLKDFTLGINVAPLNFGYHTHDYHEEQAVSVTSNNANTKAVGYTAYASGESNLMYGNQPKQSYVSFESTEVQRRLDEAIILQKKVLEQSQVMLEGESVNTDIALGGIVKIKNMNGEYFGTYRVTEVKHTYTKRGNYINKFKAVPTEIDIYPLTDISSKVMGYPEVASVMQTNDPDGMSRVKVQFPWQKQMNKTTPWIRVATPYAGGDRGFHFIPEIGDSVLIGFDSANAERPFVQSALYTGSNKYSGWQSQNNDFKGIATKGGHIIELKDTKDGEMITITDKNSNSIKIDTVNNSIEVSAIENMTFNAKNIALNAQEEVSINAGTNMSTRVTDNLSINAKNVTETLEENKRLVAKEVLNNAEKVRIESSKGNLELVSSKQVDIQGSEKVKLF